MKVSCNVIRDLLPLYAEDMASQDTIELVDAHLCSCDDCTKELAQLKKTTRLPLDVESGSLERVKQAVRRRRRRMVLAAVLTLCALWMTGAVILLTPRYLTAEEAYVSVATEPDGSVVLQEGRGVEGTGATGKATGVTIHQSVTTLYDFLKGKQLEKKLETMTAEEVDAYIRQLYQIQEVTQEDRDRFYRILRHNDTFLDENGEPTQEEQAVEVKRWTDSDHWYLNPDGSYSMLYAQGEAPEKSSPNLEYQALFLGSLALSILCWLGAGKRTGWKWELLRRLGIASASVAVATLLVTGWHLGMYREIDINTFHWPSFITQEAVTLALTGCAWQNWWITEH